MFRYYWDREKIVNPMATVKVERCFHLRKGDADAIAYETDKPSGKPHIVAKVFICRLDFIWDDL